MVAFESELPLLIVRSLELADTALSATEKAAKALELAREEQQHIRDDIQRWLQKYATAGGELRKSGKRASDAATRESKHPTIRRRVSDKAARRRTLPGTPLKVSAPRP